MVAEGDGGVPTVVARPQSAAAGEFARVARAVAEGLGWQWEGAPETGAEGDVGAVGEIGAAR